MEKVLGNHIGIVITPASEDPEGRNRVQVWVPGVTNTLYKDWNNTETDKSFYNLDTTQNNGLKQDQLRRLREMLPWAECAAPVFGGGASFAHSQPSSNYSSSSTAAPVETSTSREELIQNGQDELTGNKPLEDVPLPAPDTQNSTELPEGYTRDPETGLPVKDGILTPIPN